MRGIYKSIGRASGMDVDAIDAKARADDAAQAAASAAREAKLYSAGGGGAASSSKAPAGQ